MKKHTSKRVLTLVLAIVLTFVLAVSAFATWSSFQGNQRNNGTVSTAPPTGTSATVSSLQLATNGTVYSGIDTTPVIHSNTIYTLYNAGKVSGNAGGARLSSVSLTTGTSNWDIPLGTDANDNQQLSTPYYDTTSNTIYAGVTYYKDTLSNTPMSYWSSSAISGNTLSIPANGTVTLTLTGLVLNEVYKEAYFNTGIVASSGINMSGSVTLTNWTTSDTYNYGTSYSWTGTEFTLYNQNHVVLPSGTYDVSITLSSDTAVTTDHIALMLSNWKLYKVENANTSSPTVSVAPGIDYSLYGHGQINTHINAGGGYIYFGIFEGDRSYYQYGPINDPNTTPSLKFFKPSGTNDFYWAGAAKVGDYMVFGSEEGIVFKRSINNFDSSGTHIDLTNYATDTNPFHVRSSVCYDESNLYLTTQNGFLWKLGTNLSFIGVIDLKDNSYIMSSTSTPVVSKNNYIYVGGYMMDAITYDYHGAIKTVAVSNFSQNNLNTVWYSTTEGVQGSPIVYSDKRTSVDYIYYTTNALNGCGRCVSYAIGTSTATPLWNTYGETGSTYTLQGMAADNGYIVFGNDSNYLYIVN